MKCPQCGGVLTIPKPGTEPEAARQGAEPRHDRAAASPSAGKAESSAAGTVRGPERPPDTEIKCPSCGASLKAGAVLCVQCGYGLQTGKKLKLAGSKKKKPDRRAFPWLIVSIAGGACATIVVIGTIVFTMFLPRGAIGLGSSGTLETPKEFVEVEFGERDYKCECPKSWEVTSGGGREGVPPWTKFNKGGASIEIRDSISGTPGAKVNRALHMGTPIELGTAPVGEVHEHRKKGVADSMRNYEETAPQKLDHHLGGALIAEFTAKPLLGRAIHGYHATVLHEFHQLTIVCCCTESEWETLNPAFKRVISTLAPIESDDRPGVLR